MSAIHSTFWSWLITSNFFSIPTVFHQFFVWTALGDADLCFSLILVTKANGDEGETTSAMWLYTQHNQSLHMTVCQWHNFLLASNTDSACQITFKQNRTKRIRTEWDLCAIVFKNVHALGFIHQLHLCHGCFNEYSFMCTGKDMVAICWFTRYQKMIINKDCDRQ